MIGRVSRMTVRDALLISTVAFIGLAGLTIVAGMIVVLLSRASERASARQAAAFRDEAEIRIHAARAEAAAAIDRALAREEENLRSRERTAMLVRDAVALHAQVLATRAPPAPMAAPSLPPPAPLAVAAADGSLSPIQRGRLISVLMRSPGDVTVINGVGLVAERHAADVRAVFTAAGWRVESGVVVDPKIPLAPVSLVLGRSAQDQTVRQAFQAAGVAAADRPRSPMDRPTTVYVGS
jgi:hypothetical protein